MRYLVRTAVIALGILLSGSLAAAADPVIYNFTTSNAPFGVITTSLPASPTSISSAGDAFEIQVPVIVNGDPMTLPINFFDTATGGGLGAAGMRFSGPVLFSGSAASPTFLTGTFVFDDFTLTISPSASDLAPEPATLVLFGTGALICCWFAKRFLSTH